MGDHIMETNSHILKQFMSLTGMDETSARAILTSCQWDIEQAQTRFQQSSPTSSEKRKEENQGARSTDLKVAANNSSSAVQTERQTERKHRTGKIERGFSTVDPEMVSKLHTDIKLKGDESSDESYGYFQDVTHFSFTLPDFSQYDKEFVEFLMTDLVESSTLKALEESGHLNWWTKNNRFQRLLPLATSGDGNCLLHAASLGIWGVHDRLLNLREAVHRTLSSDLAERTIKRRWRWYQWVKNIEEGELLFSEEEWKKEWQLMLSLALAKPRSSMTKQSLTTVPEGSDSSTIDEETSANPLPKPRRFSSSSEPRYESLEEVHICSLAHVLRRPIVVVADTMLYDFEGNALSPIPFSGVYLPVECDPADCCRIPLVLAYSSGHFSPVVAMENERSRLPRSSEGSHDTTSNVQVVIPLVDKCLKILPLPFAVDPGKDWEWLKKHDGNDSIKEKSLSSEEKISLLKRYLDVVYIDVNLPPVKESVKGVQETSGTSGSDGRPRQVGDVDIPVEISVAAAELPCGNQPAYYKELIARYIDRAKERFEFEKETKKLKPKCELSSVRCANDGCDLFGTVANNYLCTKCFQLQSKSVKEFESKGLSEKNTAVAGDFPSVDPPSYSEALQSNVFYPPSYSSAGASNSNGRTVVQQVPTQCKAEGCTFYGTADRNGFCSKCYRDKKP